MVRVISDRVLKKMSLKALKERKVRLEKEYKKVKAKYHVKPRPIVSLYNLDERSRTLRDEIYRVKQAILFKGAFKK